jgi:hypothetical protein
MPETGLNFTSGREGYTNLCGSDAANRFALNSRECVHHAMDLCLPVSENSSYLIFNGRVGRGSQSKMNRRLFNIPRAGFGLLTRLSFSGQILMLGLMLPSQAESASLVNSKASASGLPADLAFGG